MSKSQDIRTVFRRLRVRQKINGTPVRPRLSVYRSLNHLYAQIIDDSSGRTLVAASSKEKGTSARANVGVAAKVGENLGKRALEKGITQVVFDRGSRMYHGRIKALADGARSAGLKF